MQQDNQNKTIEKWMEELVSDAEKAANSGCVSIPEHVNTEQQFADWMLGNDAQSA